MGPSPALSVSLGLWQDRPAAEIWIGEMATFDTFALGAVVAERTAHAALTIAAFGPGRDELPRNPLGKILKRELRDELRH